MASKTSEKYFFFYTKESPFSQHFMCQFTVDGMVYNCAEQYMMYQKAILFGDHEIAEEIMKSNKPGKQKALGRNVNNFDETVWSESCKSIVKKANIAKFSQNPDLNKAMMDTGNDVLVEASPRDCIWGIGLGANNPDAKDKSKWRGANLLGYILTEVKEELKKNK